MGRHIPYRGEPEPKLPPGFKKGRRTLTDEQVRLINFVLAFMLIALLCLIVIVGNILPSDTRANYWKIVLLLVVILLSMAGLDKGITVWNKYLKSDDLDEKVDKDEQEESVEIREK